MCYICIKDGFIKLESVSITYKHDSISKYYSDWIIHSPVCNKMLIYTESKFSKELNSMVCYELFVFLLNSYVESLTPTMAIFGDMSSKEIVKIQWGLKALIW